jgi:hypothetical protein
MAHWIHLDDGAYIDLDKVVRIRFIASRGPEDPEMVELFVTAGGGKLLLVGVVSDPPTVAGLKRAVEPKNDQ